MPASRRKKKSVSEHFVRSDEILNAGYSCKPSCARCWNSAWLVKPVAQYPDLMQGKEKWHSMLQFIAFPMLLYTHQSAKFIAETNAVSDHLHRDEMYHLGDKAYEKQVTGIFLLFTAIYRAQTLQFTRIVPISPATVQLTSA